MKASLRVAYVLLWFPKASETFIFREVVDLWKLGLQLKVFSLYGPLRRNFSPEMSTVDQQVERLGMPYLKSFWLDIFYWLIRNPAVTRRLVKTAVFRRWSYLERQGESFWGTLCGFRLARRFQEEKITHIHAPWACGAASAAWVASQLTRIPFSFTGRAYDVFTPDNLLLDKIRDAAFVRCESRAVIKRLQSLAGGENGKFILTYNGVPLITKALAMAPMEPPYRMLALGRLVAKKGFDYLIYACKILKEAGLKFYLVLAGGGPEERRLRSLVRKLGLAPQICFTGFLSYDQVTDQFQSTDIFVMPSTIEASGNRDGLPTVILEAMQHRVPVIATDVAGISEVVEDGVTGLLIPPKDPQAIAAAVLRLVRDRHAALAMAERGRTRVWQDFDPDRNHPQVLELFRENAAGMGK